MVSETTAIYLRLSKEDEQIRDESNSISNQRIQLMKFIAADKTLAATEVVEIKDDGYSGKNMQRPGITRLLDMVRSRRVQNIVVKDFSRFSRDYIELGKYVEQIFPMLGVRFISVNDNYDSRNYDGGIGGIDVATKAVLYDYYSEDLSVKVKSALKSRRSSGRYIACFAPYGYRKKQNDRYRLEPDETAAAYVRRIFEEFAAGKTMYGIAKGLNMENVPSPMKYIQQRDGRIYSRYGESSKWSNNSIRRILQNEVYTGTIVYGKAESAEVSKRATTEKPQEEWSRIENAHEAIVDRELFAKVQLSLPKEQRTEQIHEPSPLGGKVVCRSCGRRMALNRSGRTTFQCNYKYRLSDRDDFDKCAEAVREEDLLAITAELLKEKLEKLEERSRIAEMENAAHRRRERQAEAKLQSMNRSLEELYRNQTDAYESYRDGEIDREAYMAGKELTEKMAAELKAEIAGRENALIHAETDDSVLSRLLSGAGSISPENLTCEITDALIDRIIVGPGKEVEVVWKFNI